jgi:sporulation related protein
VRFLFYILLAANVALLGYAWFGTSQVNPDAELINQQINPDKVRIIPPKPMVVPTTKVACLEWGPFGTGELKAAQAALDALQPQAAVSQRDVQTVVGFWVYVPPLETRIEVERKLEELRKLGVEEYYAVESQGPMRNAISLGIFRTEEAANAYLERLREKGVRSARAGSREHRVTQAVLVVHEPSVALTAKLAELKLQFPGSELKALQCAQ